MRFFHPPSLRRNANRRSSCLCASVQHSSISESTGEAWTPRHCSKFGNSRSPIALAILTLPLPRLYHLYHHCPRPSLLSLQEFLQRPLRRPPHCLQRMMGFLHDQSLLLHLRRMTVYRHDLNLRPHLPKTTRSQSQAQRQLKRRLLCHPQR